ncbi:hypothetical protein A2U01_0085942, partial [Trifolium medium]|nr:hypothetical protein [Trifolium medium]
QEPGDKGGSAADSELGALGSLPPSVAEKDIPAITPSFWDPLFNPVEFIERQLCMVGDTSRFAATSSDDLRRMSLGHELKGMLLN